MIDHRIKETRMKVASFLHVSRLRALALLQTPLTRYLSFFFPNLPDCCLYPSGADPFMPEPDLVTLGDYCVVDCASIVCHLNTRGNFELQRITVEDRYVQAKKRIPAGSSILRCTYSSFRLLFSSRSRCTLRTRSRLQQGVVMETGSQLLEKSLAMTGEIIDARSVWQGGPATQWFRYKDEDLIGTYKPPSKGASTRELEMGKVSNQ